ncbi:MULTISPECIES: DUF6388 family protein [Burkholderia]|uniref:DUF6388 family protein n=1 Tax=Burkholderia TaxID=32008 RepID=UPI001199C159|nr:MULTISPECIES: DUF6388 family protein [Burkholderia]TWC58192.1 hypothetical protein FB600_1393 [Burkholderia sp. SJZ089]TWC92529.1 hypothetical protein FBX98_13911 [Burkholderia sp. SJZ115]TWC95639.1 hypothetical protein FB601_1403 [Burkholderia sp. SJZ091]
MSKLTPKQLSVGRQRFLDSNPEIRRRIEALTKAHSDALGISLEHLRENEIMRELSEEARAKGEDSVELFFSYIAETADEFNALVERRRATIKRNSGL